MMANEYSIRSIKPGDPQNIIELLTMGFGKWPKLNVACASIDHWKWKYEDNPLRQKNITVAEVDGKIVGVNHTFLKNVKMFDKISRFKYAADTVVHPDHRKKGIQKNMVSYNREIGIDAGIEYIYWITSNPIMVESYRKIRPQFPHKVLNMVWVEDADKQFDVIPVKNKLVMKTGFKAVKLMNQLVQTFTPNNSNLGEFNIDSIETFDERMDLFWDTMSKHYEFIMFRDREYLNWRYCDSRAGNFRVTIATEGDKVLGFCVTYVNFDLDDYPIGYIADIFTLPERLDVAEALVSEAMDMFRENSVNIINCQVIKDHPTHRILKKLGFIDSRIKLHLFYNFYNPVDELKKLEKTQPEKIHFMYGDIDSMPSSIPKAM
jgi:GNAT superfamily N-acetyltransferase/ribosomal protein S18 acetylase RimI-like enzyme